MEPWSIPCAPTNNFRAWNIFSNKVIYWKTTNQQQQIVLCAESFISKCVFFYIFCLLRDRFATNRVRLLSQFVWMCVGGHIVRTCTCVWVCWPTWKLRALKKKKTSHTHRCRTDAVNVYVVYIRYLDGDRSQNELNNILVLVKMNFPMKTNRKLEICSIRKVG